MASGQTPIRKRPYPLETDGPDVAADMHSLALNLDTAPNITQGLLSARPTGVSMPPAGDEYYATDVDIIYKSDGTNWMRTGVVDTTPTQPTRAYGTAYQPNANRPTLVVWATAETTGSESAIALIGATSSPATTVANVSLSGAGAAALTFLVPPGWYYKVTTTGSPLTPVVTECSL